MKKRYWVYILIATFLIGYLYTGLIYSGLWAKLEQGFGTISVFGYFLWFIFAFYFTLTLHELGHFLAFYFQGVKLRAIYLTVFVFYKNKSGWRFKVKPKLWVLFGGLVVPEIGEVNSDEEFDKLKDKFARSLMAAPIVTISLLFLTWVGFGCALAFSQNEALIGILAINSIYVTLLSALYIYTFTISNQMFYGDFIAYKKIKKDAVFQLITINQYRMFSLDESSETTNFLWNKTKECLTSITLTPSIFHCALLDSYLDGVINQGEKIDLVVDKKIRGLNIATYIRSEQGLSLAYEIAHYFYKLGEVQRAYQVFETINRRVSKKLDSKMRDYLRKRSSHLLHIKYYRSFLDNKENYYVGHAWIFDVLVDPYEMLKEYHQVLPFVKYVSAVDFEERRS